MGAAECHGAPLMGSSLSFYPVIRKRRVTGGKTGIILVVKYAEIRLVISAVPV